MAETRWRYWDLGCWLGKLTGARQLVNRTIGRELREIIEKKLAMEEPGTIIMLDCHGIDIMEFTGTDECFGKLVDRLQNKEYGEVYLIFEGLTASHERLLSIALEEKSIASIVHGPDDYHVVGALGFETAQQWHMLEQRKKLTARDVADETGDYFQTVSWNLSTLHTRHLCLRHRERLPGGGRQYVYQSISGVC